MDLQLFIAINLTSISLVAILVLLINRPVGAASWIAVHGLVVVASAAALYALPNWAGTIVAILFVPLVLLPTVFSVLVNRGVNGSRIDAAARYAGWVVLLHPTARTRFQAATLKAQSHASLEDRRAAIRALEAGSSPSEQVALRMQLLRTQDDWPGLLDLAQANPGPASEMRALEIRALGECGRLDEMVSAFVAAKPSLIGADLATSLLFVLAFTGRGKGVERLLDGALTSIPDEAKAYWRAIALKAGGGPELPWRSPLRRLASEAASPTLRLAAERHLSTPPVSAEYLSPAGVRALDWAEDWLANQPARSRNPLVQMPATLGLFAANIAMFAFEENWGGSENLRALVRLGAMWPIAIIEDGEWWRLGTALFLHYGALHLAVNMFLLLLLGRESEARVGSLRFLTVYLGGGIVSTAAVLALMWYRYTPPAVLVGASGAIFALIGLEVARRIVGWARTRDVLDRRGLLLIAAVLVIQFGIDLQLPQVSLSAHVSGLVAGLFLGLLLGTDPRRSFRT
ncbi:MAG: rhomboid family intramembrane serine protease [Hyphomicrobiaceae bacterium]